MSPDICCTEPGSVLAAAGTAIGAIAIPAITTTASKVRKKDVILIPSMSHERGSRESHPGSRLSDGGQR